MYRAALYSKRLSLYIGDILLIDKAHKIMIKIKNVVSCTVAFVTAFAAHTAFATRLAMCLATPLLFCRAQGEPFATHCPAPSHQGCCGAT